MSTNYIKLQKKLPEKNDFLFCLIITENLKEEQAIIIRILKK